jgi:hypothetical protein
MKSSTKKSSGNCKTVQKSSPSLQKALATNRDEVELQSSDQNQSYSFCIDAPASGASGSLTSISSEEFRRQCDQEEPTSPAVRRNGDADSDVPNPLGLRPSQMNTTVAGTGEALIGSVPSFDNWSFHSAPASQQQPLVQVVAKSVTTPMESVVEQRPGPGLQILSDASGDKSLAGVLFEVCPALWESRQATPHALSVTEADEGRRPSRSAGALMEPAYTHPQAPYVLPPVLSTVGSFISSFPSIDPAAGATADLEWLEFHSRGRASPGFTTSEPEDPRWWELHVRRAMQQV